jgi:ATP-dependent Clp endopeptidase proteolytic subunit ClpP
MHNLQQLLNDNRENGQRRYEVRGAAKDEAEIFLYDAIGGFFGIDAGKFAKDLKAIKAQTIHLRINSPGGDVFAARAIATAIKEHPGTVVAHVDGLAASAASFIMLSASRIVASDGAFVMLHNPWSLTIGDASDHEAAAGLLSKIQQSMVADYARHTGKPESEVQSWMDDETWFSANEAKEVGLVDEVADVITAAASAHWNLTAYRNAPASLLAGDGEQAVAAMTTATEPPAEQAQGTAPEERREIRMENPTINAGQTVAPDLEAVRAEERRRISELQRIGAAARMSAEQIAAAVDSNTSVQAFREQAFDAVLAQASTHETRVGVAFISDGADKRRSAFSAAVLNRVAPSRYAVDGQNEFRGMSCLRMAEESLLRAGISVRGLTPSELAVKAMQNTADFPYVLENSARKLLLDAYGLVNPTYKLWTKPSTTPDFKTMSRARLGETPTFLQVAEGAQITIANMTESREQYAIATYGRGVSFTRQMLINDDLGAFNDLISAFGAQAARLENKTVYAILTANANMADSVTLFHAGTHFNSGTGVIGDTALEAAYAMMRKQKGLDLVSVLNIEPKFLIVPVSKEVTAKRAMLPVGEGVKASDRNMFAGRFTVVADAELDGSSTTAWYLAADPSIYPGIEYAHLEGATGPQIIREENAGGILGVTLMAFLDFGAKAVDWRPLYYSTGS